MSLERKSGILAHPTSFPSNWGIGDLGYGTYNFIDFLSKSNQKLWQILPLGPTSFGDSPYQCFSTFAGNHYLISLDELINEGILTLEELSFYPKLNDKKVEYGDTIENKNKALEIAYNNFKNKGLFESDENYKKFVKNSKWWLDDYCLFMAIKYYLISERDGEFEPEEWHKYKEDKKDYLSNDEINAFFYGAVWNSWPSDIANREEKAVKKWAEKLENEINLHKFLQYKFFTQWSNVKKYANARNIEIIGDIPIFVALDSSDVWANKELFHIDKEGNPTSVAGVPPDYFSTTGQLWGNPLYKWDTHSKLGYKWWIKRISSMLNLVDTIRIDHFRGFDEYWSVPYGSETAINGKWIQGPRKELFYALEKELGNLPIIAEDLGILTKTVEELRDELGLPGMKILQFAFDLSDGNFYIPHNYKNSNCIVYSGTHDNDTTVGWYNGTTEEQRDACRRYMNVSGEDIAWDFIRLAWSTTASYSIAPIQDLFSLGSEHRMNTPGVSVGNWQFRYTYDMLNDEIANRLTYLTKLFER
ncbi:MAG: 4-alpha-glucanotransferase [Lachnospirales bacterium]